MESGNGKATGIVWMRNVGGGLVGRQYEICNPTGAPIRPCGTYTADIGGAQEPVIAREDGTFYRRSDMIVPL